MSYPRLYFGTVSKNAIDAVIDVANHYGNQFEFPLGLIASRRQVDYDSGYVGSTIGLYDYIKKSSEYVYLCRDHGGPNQGAIEDDGKRSFNTDVRCMDIIHIDPWKFVEECNLLTGIDLTEKYIKHFYKANTNIQF